MEFGGSHIRTEATGYGCVYFMKNMLTHANMGDLEEKVCIVSGAGNVALHAIEKLIDEGAKVVGFSDSSGRIHDPDGVTTEKLAFLKDLVFKRRGWIDEYSTEYGCDYKDGGKVWDIPCDYAFPCATQNELDDNDALELIKNGCVGVCEGANMPCTPQAVHLFESTHGLVYAPGKAANAGGVAISALEMSQNSMRLQWSPQQVDAELLKIMKSIHTQCVEYGEEKDYVNYVKGANIAGFIKVAKAMIAFGIN
jgi:glutamate dehydrogenase (NADP+)